MNRVAEIVSLTLQIQGATAAIASTRALGSREEHSSMLGLTAQVLLLSLKLSCLRAAPGIFAVNPPLARP